MSRYLIVDDEPLIRKGLAKLVSRVAPQWELCGEAWNGSEALELTERCRPDLIFTDIRMPDMDGLTMAKHLIDRAFAIPLVFFSGYDEFAYVQTAIKYHAFDYLLKPIKEDDVRLLFDRYEQEFGTPQTLQQNEVTTIKQYEQFLVAVLENHDAQELDRLSEWYDRLKSTISLRSFVHITFRTFNYYLLRFGILEFEYAPVLNSSNTPNVIKKLQEYCIAKLRECSERMSQFNHSIEAVKSWVNEHINEKITLADAAKQVHLNPTYFSEYFKKSTDQTFLQYVIECKIDRAKQLLSDSALHIYDVSCQVGYTDHRHFSRVFQSRVGMTPSEYRARWLGMK